MKKLTSILLLALMLTSLALPIYAVDIPAKEYPQKFWDVSKDFWAFSYIAELTDRGVISGYEDGSFKPNATVTRAEWAKIMVGAAGMPANDNSVNFNDVSGHWAITHINAAKDYLTAYADGSYRPDQAAVREDVTVAMVKLKGYDVSSVDFSHLAKFSDVDSISNNMKTYVAVAVEKGLISGFEDNTFRGQATLTRAEAATLLWRAFQMGSDNKVTDGGNASTGTQATPTPTPQTSETPSNSPEPTQTPTQTPTPTETPEQTPDTKPYVIDTIVKASISADVIEDYYTYDGNDTIYYLASGKIYSLNVNTKSVTELYNLGDLIIDTEEMTLSDFVAISICYDTYRERLLVQGSYKKINATKPIYSQYLYDIGESGAEVITDNLDSYDEHYIYNENKYVKTGDGIIGVLSNGDYITHKRIIDATTYKPKTQYSNAAYTPDNIVEVDNKIYYLYCSGNLNLGACPWYFGCYDFTKTNELWSLPHSYSYSVGYTNNSVIVTNKQSVITYNFAGKELSRITANDYSVADMTALDFDHTAHKLFIMNDNSIVFYDTSAKAFRILKKADL